jgi:nitroreductase
MAKAQHQSRLIDDQGTILDNLIFQRRSIRKYKPDPLPEAWVKAMLQCALQAPSPSNSQPVVFVHIDSQHRKESLQQALAEGYERLITRYKANNGPARLRNWINAYRRYAEFMFTAPVLLAAGVRHGIRGFASRLAAGGLLEDDSRWQCDPDITVGLALKGLLLNAQALGVGSCILTAPLVFIADVEPLLGLEKISIRAFVTLGLADEAPPPTPRKPLSEAVVVI